MSVALTVAQQGHTFWFFGSSNRLIAVVTRLSDQADAAEGGVRERRWLVVSGPPGARGRGRDGDGFDACDVRW